METAKGLRDFAKANPQLLIKGGVLDGKSLTPAEIDKLAQAKALLQPLGTALVVSVFADTVENFARVAGRVAGAAPDLVERGPGRHLLGEQGGLDAMEQPLQPADQLGLGDPQFGVAHRLLERRSAVEEGGGILVEEWTGETGLRDAQRQDIAWVRVTGQDGRTREYSNQSSPLTESDARAMAQTAMIR